MLCASSHLKHVNGKLTSQLVKFFLRASCKCRAILEMVRKHPPAEDCSFALMLDSPRVAVAMPSLPKTSSQMQSK